MNKTACMSGGLFVMPKISYFSTAGFEPGGKTTFADTPDTYWGTPYVSTLADLAIVKGTDGFFNPHRPITRAQFVSMTSLALEEMERRANN